jgi:uncharacterized protein (DUF1330 family)
MPAFVIADIDVHDPQRYEDYKAGSPASLAEFGGRFVARGGAIEVLEGDWDPARVVIIEFPDADSARRWYGSAGYQDLKAIRDEAASGRFVLVDGVNP